MLVTISWKNVWRNKTRSLVVICSVLLGIFGGIFATAIMNGWIKQRMHDAVYNEISHVQIHNPQFMNNEELNLTIDHFDSLTAALDTMTDVLAYSSCIKVFAMLQSDWSATGAVIKGINPENEKKVYEIYKNIIEGDYFESRGKIPSIVIGSKMAESLKLKNYQVTPEKLDSLNNEDYPQSLINHLKEIENIRFRTEKDFKTALQEHLTENEYKEQWLDYFSFYRIGAKISLTLQTLSGELITPTFRVKGIYKTSNSLFDAMTAYVEKDIMAGFIGFQNNVAHEVSIISKDNSTGHLLGEKMAFSYPQYNVMSWKRLSPELSMYADFGKVFNYIYVVIILFALAFGIINTMLMVVLERVKELGMLMAIGMNKLRVFYMIMLESVFLTFTGAFAGMILSGVLVKILSNSGINFSFWAEGFEAIGYSSKVYPFMTMDAFIGISLLVILTGVIASVWPARKALKLNPAEAIRSDV